MSRLDTAGLVEMAVLDRYPIHHQFCCQYEHEFYNLHAPVKHIYTKYKMQHQLHQ